MAEQWAALPFIVPQQMARNDPTKAIVEAMVQDWLATPDFAAQKRIATVIDDLALDRVATVPLGQFFLKTAYRGSITGILQGIGPYPWNVRPA